MQTFLPYKDFLLSAQVLDKKRCWKQVVEAKQIIDVLEGKTVAWSNHPAVKMWEGHIDALKAYFNAFLMVSEENHNINTKYTYFLVPSLNTIEMPWWLGNKDFHRAMRARLIEKDRTFYLQWFSKYDEGFNKGKYLWPVMEYETFRMI